MAARRSVLVGAAASTRVLGGLVGLSQRVPSQAAQAKVGTGAVRIIQAVPGTSGGVPLDGKPVKPVGAVRRRAGPARHPAADRARRPPETHPNRRSRPGPRTLLAVGVLGSLVGPYVELLSVRADQKLQVTTRHLRQDFTIRSRRLLPQGSLADDPWLFSPTGDQDLAVVTAVPAKPPVHRSQP